MENQKIINLIDNGSNQPSKFRTKNWIEINDLSNRAYSTSSEIRLKTTMLKYSLCDYSDAYILVKGTIKITGNAGLPTGRSEAQLLAARQAYDRNKGAVFKNCAPFTNFKIEINNTKIDNAKDIDIVMAMYNLIEYNNNYSKTSASLWWYYKDEPNDNLADSKSFKSKAKTTGSTPNNGNTNDVEIIVTSKYLSNFRELLK